MNSWIAAAAIALLIPATGVGQDTAARVPNIAVSGCLLGQGYATFLVDDARIDATGDQSASAQPAPRTSSRPAGEPAKWILDQPGNVRAHVGERVQVVGTTEWKRGDPIPGDEPGADAPIPHLTVISVKYLAPRCS